MKRGGRSRARRDQAGGYAVLMAIFMVASLALIVTVATPSVLLQGRRQREDDAVWRGKQYVRAIRLYFQKNGRFPASLDDLTKTGADNVHFLRKVYKDPVNRDDGSWRPIYMSPSGALTGSVRYQTIQEAAAAQGFVAQAGGASSAGTPSAGILPTQAGAQAAATQPGNSLSPNTQPANGQSPNAQQQGAQAPGAQQSTTQPGSVGLSQLSSSSTSSFGAQGQVLGGQLVGVGSKVKQPSLRVYQGGERYEEWEFIFNPLGNTGQLPGQAPGGGIPPAAAGGGSPATAAPGAGTGQPPAGLPPLTGPGRLDTPLTGAR